MSCLEMHIHQLRNFKIRTFQNFKCMISKTYSDIFQYFTHHQNSKPRWNLHSWFRAS